MQAFGWAVHVPDVVMVFAAGEGAALDGAEDVDRFMPVMAAAWARVDQGALPRVVAEACSVS